MEVPGPVGVPQHDQGLPPQVESLLLEAIQQDLFTEEGYAIVRQEMTRLLAERRRSRTPDLAKVKARLARRGTGDCQLADRDQGRAIVTKHEDRAGEIGSGAGPAAQPAQRKAKAEPVADFLPNAIGRFKAALADLTTVTQHQVDKARDLLRVLLGSVITLHPTANGAERYLTAEISGDYAGLLRL